MLRWIRRSARASPTHGSWSNRSCTMLTRRSALLGSTLAVAASPALASRVSPAGGKGKKGAAPESAGSPADTPLGPVDTTARWAYVQDFTTGASLLEKQADDRMPPSSMTKLMTIYIVYERLK